MRDLGQSTQEQVEYVKGQNNALQAQLKRSGLEIQQTADVHAARLQHALTEQEAMSATLRKMEREVNSLESSRLRNPDVSSGHHEESVPGAGLREFIQNRIELETTRTTSACEKMLAGASSEIASERAARLEMERFAQRTGAQVESLQIRYEHEFDTLQRRLADSEALQAQETKLREETENSIATQQKMAALRLEEFLTLQISSELAEVVAEVASLKQNAADSIRDAEGAAANRSAPFWIEKHVARIDGVEQEQVAIQQKLLSLSETMESVQSAGKVALNFEERNRVINAKFRDMVAVCGNVVQEAERTQKELLAQRSEQEHLKQGACDMASRIQGVMERIQALHLRGDQSKSSLSKSALQGVEERLAILEAESTIRRQQRILSDPTLPAEAGDGPSGLPDAFESRILIQVRVLEEKLLAVLKEEDTILQEKVDAIHENLQQESAERVLLGSTLSARMEDRIKSLADVIDTATSEAVKEMSALFEPEMQRLRQQFDASQEALVSSNALETQVQALVAGRHSLPEGLRQQLETLVENKMSHSAEQLQMLQAEFRAMLQGSHAAQARPDRQVEDKSLDQAHRSVEAKLAGFERALKLQQDNRQLLEEQVFSVRRSVPVVDRLAKSVSESLRRQQHTELEVAAFKQKLSEERQDAQDAERLAHTVETRLDQADASLAKVDGEVASLTSKIWEIQRLESRLDQTDASVKMAQDEVRSVSATTHSQLAKVEGEVARLASTLENALQEPEASPGFGADGSATHPTSHSTQAAGSTDAAPPPSTAAENAPQEPEASPGFGADGSATHPMSHSTQAAGSTDAAPPPSTAADKDTGLHASRPVADGCEEADSAEPDPVRSAVEASAEVALPTQEASTADQDDPTSNDWLDKLTESVNSLEAVLSSDDTSGADAERLASDEEEPHQTAAAPQTASAQPLGQTFSFSLTEDASEEEGPPAAAGPDAQEEKEVWERDFEPDTLSFD